MKILQRPISDSLVLLSRVGMAAAAMLALPSMPAATFFWDSDATGTGNNVLSGGGLGGAGNWNSSVSNWWPGTGTVDQSWVNAGGNSAVFWGTAGTVTLTDPITVGGIQFNTTGYTINTGANTLTFAAGTNTIALNNVAAASITGAVGGSGNVILTRGNSTAGTITLRGTSTTGWTGTTVISNGVTVALSESSQALVSTSGITLGGNLTLTNTSPAEAVLDRVSNTAPIASSGGTFTVTNTVAAATPYTETIGSVSLNSGLLNVVSTNANTGGNQVLTLSGLTLSGTSTVAFSGGGGLNTGTNQIKVTGATATAPNRIIGPWATTGTSAAAQTDYAVYNGTGNIVAANIAASAETTWTTSTDSYTLNGATTLTGTRSITSLRYTGAAGTLALNGNNLETNGILNGGSGLLTISGTGAVMQQGTAAANLYISTGNADITITSPVINNTGALTLVKTGSGKLTLNGANTYTGDTIVQAGTLQNGSTTRIQGNLIVGSLGGGSSAAFSTSANPTSLFKTNGTSNVTIYSNGSAWLNNNGDGYVNNITIIGGSLTVSNFYAKGPITMTGGTFAGSVYGSVGSVVTNASPTTATLSAFQSSAPFAAFSFNVADGGAAIDLNVTGQINASSFQATNGITKLGAGLMAIGSSNTYSGATAVNAGTLLLTNTNALQNSPLTNGGTGIEFDASVASHAFTIGGLNGSGNLALLDNASNPVALSLNAAGVTSRTYGGVMSGAGSVVKTGTGTQILNGNQTYTGATTVSAGTLQVGGTINSTSGVSVNGGVFNYANNSTALNRAVTVAGGNFKYNSTQAYSGALTFTSGTISGSGNLSGTSFSIGSGRTLSPGNSPGTLTTGAESWDNGGTYLWEINALATSVVPGTEGGTTGWDFANINGVLTITAGPGQFTLSLDALAALNSWNDASNYQWRIATASGGVSGFNPASFAIDTSAFSDQNPFTGTFAVTNLGNDVFLTYTAIPEPSAYVLISLAMGAFLLRRKRNK